MAEGQPEVPEGLEPERAPPFRYRTDGYFYCAHCKAELGEKHKVATIYTTDRGSFERAKTDPDPPFPLELALEVRPVPPPREGKGGATLAVRAVYLIPCSRCRVVSVKFFRQPTLEEKEQALREYHENQGKDVDELLASGRELPEPKAHEHVYPRGAWKTVTRSDFIEYVRSHMSPYMRRAVIEGFRTKGIGFFPLSMMAETAPAGP